MGLRWSPVGPNRSPNGAQMGSKSLRSPFQNQLCDRFDCSEAACALRHAIWTEKGSQVGIDSGKTCAQHRSNKAAGCFAKYYVLPEENSVLYCRPTSKSGTISNMRDKKILVANDKHEVFGTRFRHISSSTMGFFSKPDPANNPPCTDGLAHQWSPVRFQWSSGGASGA